MRCKQRYSLNLLLTTKHLVDILDLPINDQVTHPRVQMITLVREAILSTEYCMCQSLI